jgi:hypothetical protein
MPVGEVVAGEEFASEVDEMVIVHLRYEKRAVA